MRRAVMSNSEMQNTLSCVSAVINDRAEEVLNLKEFIKAVLAG